MKYSQEKLRHIYMKTDGRCANGWEPLRLEKYGKWGSLGAWEVDHSKARAKDGTDHMNNLNPSCISCNRSKKAQDAKKFRRKMGYIGPPMSAKMKGEIREENSWTTAVVVGATGLFVGGPVFGFAGAVLGRLLGRFEDPERERKMR
jgi:hypothetical protein